MKLNLIAIFYIFINACTIVPGKPMGATGVGVQGVAASNTNNSTGSNLKSGASSSSKNSSSNSSSSNTVSSSSSSKSSNSSASSSSSAVTTTTNTSGLSGVIDLAPATLNPSSYFPVPVAKRSMTGVYAQKYTSSEYLRSIYASSEYHQTRTQLGQCIVNCQTHPTHSSCTTTTTTTACTAGAWTISFYLCSSTQPYVCSEAVVENGGVVEFSSLDINPTDLPYVGYASITVCESRNGSNSFITYSADPAAATNTDYSVSPPTPGKSGHQGSLNLRAFSDQLTTQDATAKISFTLENGYFLETTAGVAAANKKSFRANIVADNIEIFPQQTYCP